MRVVAVVVVVVVVNIFIGTIFKYRDCVKLQYVNNNICKQESLINSKIQNFRSLIVIMYISIIARIKGNYNI